MGNTIRAKGGTLPVLVFNSSSWHVPLATHAKMQHKEAMDLTSMEIALLATSLMQEESA
jgi:hypothetical protein